MWRNVVSDAREDEASLTVESRKLVLLLGLLLLDWLLLERLLVRFLPLLLVL